MALTLRTLPMASAARGPMAAGCEQCEEGRKMVLFVSGLCPFRCFYCPVSERRNQKDSVYANERPVTCDEDILEEAQAMGASGTGITGGDPLYSFERTLHIVKLLKENLGRKHHIHLYTREPNPAKIRALAEAGLDEVRLHIPHYLWGTFETRGQSFRKILDAAPGWGLARGVEIPLIPDKEKDLRKLLQSLSDLRVDFVNLNEFEFSETNEKNLLEREYHVNPGGGWGVQGSRIVARRLLKEAWGVPVHFCSSGFKDSVQLRQRLLRRGARTMHSFDVLTEDGTVLKGIIEIPGSQGPLDRAYREVQKTLGIDPEACHLNEVRRRIEVSPYLLRREAGRLRFPAFEVEEYPTTEATEVERSPLNGAARAALAIPSRIETGGV
ncbi:MAG: radical SAM protein [Candidatus Thermoplasmatota archaeon]|nr:radical SAM protein [Candidatus Thermoplasmatota archaeon]MCL5984639.1 radical SAM protein [Candidatus Thermoplasmatota archaeon]